MRGCNARAFFPKVFCRLDMTSPIDTLRKKSYRNYVSAGKMPLKAAGADKPAEKDLEAEHDSAPAKAFEQPTAKPAAAKGKGSAIASMWSKAPAKKARKAAPKHTPAPAAAKSKAAAVDAEAFLRLNQQV